MLKQLSLNAQKFVDLSKTLSTQEKAAVAAHLAGEVAEAARNAAPQTIVTMAEELASSVQSAKSSGRIETIDGHQAVLGTITVQWQRLDTLLSEGSFSKKRAEQIAYASDLGYRLATLAENQAYVDSLLAKDKDKTINDAEVNALTTYRQRFVRDTAGGLAVSGGYVHNDVDLWDDGKSAKGGALFVRTLRESK